ncbi:hypothetical protein AB0N79_06715 [Streptomyces microflavus]|uniref:hypothetical protein n=1 Tax=Streptomyces microflavus TaxID=1919 RepID=UPI003444931A
MTMISWFGRIFATQTLRGWRSSTAASFRGPDLKGMGELRYVVDQTFALLHQFKRLAVYWERCTELHDTLHDTLRLPGLRPHLLETPQRPIPDRTRAIMRGAVPGEGVLVWHMPGFGRLSNACLGCGEDEPFFNSRFGRIDQQRARVVEA